LVAETLIPIQLILLNISRGMIANPIFVNSVHHWY